MARSAPPVVARSTPREVEELVVRHPCVANAALVAMPDEVLGEKARAYLVLETEPSR
jgi:non-ribosomal peptide synthetase component E (peptide arylation enzyme)